MKKIIFTLSLLVSLQFAVYAQIDEQFITGEREFGNAVAMDGDWAVVGNKWLGRIDNGGTFYDYAGEVFIYKRHPNGLWVQHSILREQCWYTETGEQHGLNYGQAVDISDGWLAVGADYDSDDNGAIGPDGVVFLYKYDSDLDAWISHTTLHGALHPVNNFGFSVALGGNQLVVGDPDFGAATGEAYKGTAYIYKNIAGNWSLDQQLFASDGWASGGPISQGYGDIFGYDVAVNDYFQRVVIGAPFKGVQTSYSNRLGSVYVYEYDADAGSWAESYQLHDPNWNDVSHLGFSVDIADKMIVAGAPGVMGGADNNTGKIFAIEKHTGVWQSHALAQPADWSAGDLVGFDVSVAVSAVDSGNQDEPSQYFLLAGAPGDDGLTNINPNQGAGWLFALDIPYVANAPSKVSSPNVSDEGQMGYAVYLNDLSEDCIIGATFHQVDNAGLKEGAVMLYSFAEASEGIWQGTVDTDWSKPANWSDGIVPNGNTTVTIANDAANMPVLDTLGFCLNLTLDQGETLTLDGYGALLRVNGDATINGEFIIPAGEFNDLARIEVQGITNMFLEKNKQLPGGSYQGRVTIDASTSTYKANLAGDAFMYGELGFGSSTRGKLDISDRSLELHGLIWGRPDQGLVTNSNSNLILAGTPPIPFKIPYSVSVLNNLVVDNGEGVSHINRGSLSINGTLTLNSGQFKVFTTSGVSTLNLYNSVAGDPSLFWTDHESAVWIMGSNPDIQYPSGSSEVFGLVVNNPNEITLNNDLLVHSYLYLLTGGANANGHQVSFAAEGELWSAADITIDDGLFDLNNPPHKIHVAIGSNVLFDAVGVVDNIEIGGFPAPMNLSPEILNEIVAGQNRSINNITSLEIQPQKGITVQNEFIANSGALVLKSSINGNSSFIDDRNNPDNVTATVENYLTSGRWHLVSPSVVQATAEAYFVENGSDIWMKEFNEATSQWEYISSLTHPLIPGKGYAIWVDADRADETAVYEGVLNNGDHTVNLNYSGDDRGWNLIGNPFPSSLDLSVAGWSQSNTTGVVYVYDNGNYVSSNLSGDGTLTNAIIPPGQGFFVQANAANANFTLPQNARVHAAQSFYKEPASTVDALILTVSKDGKRDKTWISFDAAASDEFDEGRDAWRLQGDAGMPQLYTRFGDKQLAINIHGELLGEKSIPVYFEAAQNGNYSLEFSLLESFADAEIMLEDHITGQLINLNEQAIYNFEAITGSDPHRFTLHFSRTVTGTESVISAEPSVKIYSQNGQLIAVSKIGFKGGILRLYSLSGQLLMQSAFEKTNALRIDAEAFKNQLIVVVLSDSGFNHTTKVLVN